MNVIDFQKNVRGSFLAWIGLSSLVAALLCISATTALAETRSLKLRHLHTGETAEIVYKRNGRYDQAGLKKINIMLRDWRRNEPTRMDPRLLDLVWQVYRASGSTAYINVVSGYRSPATNAMLRSRSKGVARESQHMVGRAMDFFLPDVPLKKLRDISLRMQGGGVGFYPTSGSPFLHIDVGNIRHWPGISRQELARIFPDGKTLHLPSDGKPLPGYDQAFVAYKSRRESGARNVELASVGDSQRKPRGLLASLLGGRGQGQTEAVASAAPTPRKPARPADAAQVRQGIAIVAPKDAQRANIQTVPAVPVEEAPAERKPETPEATVAALALHAVPLPVFAERRDPAPNSVRAETIPFAISDGTATRTELPTAGSFASERVALNIPVPSGRPENRQGAAPQPNAVKSEDAIATLLAVKHPDEGPALPTSKADTIPPSEMTDHVRTSQKADRLRSEAPAVAMRASYRPIERDLTVTGAIGSAKPPRAAAAFIRTAAAQVYTDGFRSDREPSDHRRFTGSSVEFLPIASFK
ncbi:peptidase M15 [Mesorhizobium loti]|nr:DUF882 domain-containing protein [Mesorhizobium loti]PLP60306.1 peptidase M15 [Mesorhizobium loti]